MSSLTVKKICDYFMCKKKFVIIQFDRNTILIKERVKKLTYPTLHAWECWIQRMAILQLGFTPRKKFNQTFLWICASTHYVLHNYKVSLNSVERFRGVVLARKTGLMDWLTDCLTDGSKSLYPPQLVAWGIKNRNSFIQERRVDLVANIVQCFLGRYLKILN